MDKSNYTNWSDPPPSYTSADPHPTGFSAASGVQQAVNEAQMGAGRNYPPGHMSEVIIDGRKAYIPTSAVAQIASTARPVDVSNMPDPVWPEPPGPRRGNGSWATMRVNNRVAYAPCNYMCHSGTVLGMIVMFINPICGAIGMVLGIMAMSATTLDSDADKALRLARYSKIASLVTIVITVGAIALIVWLCIR